MSKGTIKKVAGPLVIAKGMRDANMYDVVRVSEKRLTGEQLIPLSKTLLISCGYFAVCVVTMGTYRLPSCVRYLLAVTAFPIGAWYFLPRVKPILKMMKKRKKQ